MVQNRYMSCPLSPRGVLTVPRLQWRSPEPEGAQPLWAYWACTQIWYGRRKLCMAELRELVLSGEVHDGTHVRTCARARHGAVALPRALSDASTMSMRPLATARTRSCATATPCWHHA